MDELEEWVRFAPPAWLCEAQASVRTFTGTMFQGEVLLIEERDQ